MFNSRAIMASLAMVMPTRSAVLRHETDFRLLFRNGAWRLPVNAAVRNAYMTVLSGLNPFLPEAFRYFRDHVDRLIREDGWSGVDHDKVIRYDKRPGGRFGFRDPVEFTAITSVTPTAFRAEKFAAWLMA